MKPFTEIELRRAYERAETRPIQKFSADSGYYITARARCELCDDRFEAAHTSEQGAREMLMDILAVHYSVYHREVLVPLDGRALAKHIEEYG